jgi:hypothetical protein
MRIQMAILLWGVLKEILKVNLNNYFERTFWKGRFERAF